MASGKRPALRSTSAARVAGSAGETSACAGAWASARRRTQTTLRMLLGLTRGGVDAQDGAVDGEDRRVPVEGDLAHLAGRAEGPELVAVLRVERDELVLDADEDAAAGDVRRAFGRDLE